MIADCNDYFCQFVWMGVCGVNVCIMHALCVYFVRSST